MCKRNGSLSHTGVEDVRRHQPQEWVRPAQRFTRRGCISTCTVHGPPLGGSVSRGFLIGGVRCLASVPHACWSVTGSTSGQCRSKPTAQMAIKRARGNSGTCGQKLDTIFSLLRFTELPRGKEGQSPTTEYQHRVYFVHKKFWFTQTKRRPLQMTNTTALHATIVHSFSHQSWTSHHLPFASFCHLTVLTRKQQNG